MEGEHLGWEDDMEFLRFTVFLWMESLVAKDKTHCHSADA